MNLIQVYEEYILLLSDELSEMVGIAAAHGWKSTRFEKDLELRNKIELLKYADKFADLIKHSGRIFLYPSDSK